MHEPSIHFETDSQGRQAVTVIGELDATTAPALRHALLAASIPPDIVDLRFAGLLSAAAVNVLVEAFERRGFRTIGSVIVERVLGILELDELLGVHRADAPPALVGAPFGVAVHDTDLRYVFVNDALADINGLPASSHLRHRADELFHVERDDITPIMRSVSSNHRPRTIRVTGSTPTAAGSWICSYRASRYIERGDLLEVVVATVESEAAESDGAIDPPPLMSRSPSQRHQPVRVQTPASNDVSTQMVRRSSHCTVSSQPVIARPDRG